MYFDSRYVGAKDAGGTPAVRQKSLSLAGRSGGLPTLRDSPSESHIERSGKINV